MKQMQNNRAMEEILSSSRKTHAFLIAGESREDNEAFAREMAKALLCEGEIPPCGACLACRKMESGSHPEFAVLSSGDKKSISVERAREFKDDIHYLPGEGKYRVYLILNAEDLTIQAQNSLLKMLEEPPAYARFILTASEEKSLLPTVLSRLFLVRVPPLPEKTLFSRLQSELSDRSKEEILTLCRLSGGYFFRARALAAAGREKTSAARLLSLFSLAAEQKYDSYKDAGKTLLSDEKKDLDLLCARCLVLLRDLAAAKSGADLYFCADRLQIENLCTKMKEKSITKMVKIVYETKNMLRMNANFHLLSWFFLSQIWEAIN